MHTDLRSVIFVLILRIISTSLAKSLFEDIHLNEFINSRQLREDGFNEFELTSVQEVTSSHKQSLDASSIHRRRRSVDSTESYEIEMSAFGESYKMTLQHTKSVLHPSAKVSILTDQEETEWEGDRPDCFLIGNVHSHDGTVSASFCEELRGIMSTSNHDLHFEVLPHHIRKRGTLGSKQHTTMIARKRREDLLFSDLSQTNDIHQTEYNHERIHKRSVPSTDFTIELAVYVDADYLTYKLPASNMTRRVENMVCKYNAVQFEWSRADVLNYNITLSIKLLTFFDTNPSWYNASTALSVPLNTICTGTEAGLAYDHVHVHTGIPSPELGGLAYQSQVCNARYRCGVSADGITSYGTVVHEIGHNMGMLHDADRNCLSPDVGIMGGAGVGWSTCSCNDMNTMLQTGNHGCLWTDNIADNEVTPVSLLGLTLVPELPGQLKTADEICEQLYGSGFRYREYPDVVNPACNLYSCVDHNVGITHGQMFKQSDSIPGLYCEDQKICFGGACVDWSAAQMNNPEVRAGGWSDWGTWTTCSRTCGRGMLYRRRICNNPTPKNNASCDGDEYEAQGCSLTPCVGDNTIDSNLIIQRASETCQRLIDNNIINGTEYTASGTIYSSLNHGVCEVLCDSAPGYTRPSFTRFGLIENGTPCPGTLDAADANQYSRRPGFYHACLEGYCQRFDCANTLNDGVFDGCGVCNGDNSTCIIREGNFTDDVPLWGQREWTEIPVGAYNIEMSFVWNDMKQYYTEIYNKEGHPIITSHLAESRIFQTGNSPVSFGGTLWHNDAFVAIMHAKGPLTEPVIVKVYSIGSNSNTGMKYIYSVPIDIDSCSGTCENGTWNTDICACDCESGFTGSLCNSDCSTLCNNGAAVNESTCECICNEQKQNGSKCDCKYPFTGGYCDTCAFVTCYNGGVFNATSCNCTCLDDNDDLQCKIEQSTTTVSTVSSTAFSNGSSEYNDDIDITFIIIIVCVGVSGIGIVIICWCFIVIICKKKKCRVSNGCCVCCVVSDKCCFCCVVRNRCCVFSNKCSDKAVFTKVIPFKR
ncbi:A disintegrin and metalloproteinase with thrombospondin motifs 16-like isoform X2 [Mytilus edulis]|uniref:A disintegrin and metalloproteinase with thrombospondin motifs 16-like isoform X2 n=1 Tax=Mytilus edulis TaxID=6550 RepID=UPI0039EDF029